MNMAKPNTTPAAASHQVVRLDGRLDAVSVARNKQALMNQVTDSGCSIVLNLKDVNFIDSTGLGLLVALHKQLQTSGFTMAVCEMSEQARLLFELTRLNQIFDLYDAEAHAVSALQQG